MSGYSSGMTVQELVAKVFATESGISANPLEAHGIIEGGVIVIRGERQWEQAKLLLFPSPAPSTQTLCPEAARAQEVVGKQGEKS